MIPIQRQKQILGNNILRPILGTFLYEMGIYVNATGPFCLNEPTVPVYSVFRWIDFDLNFL